jgi:hypothetical protein
VIRSRRVALASDAVAQEAAENLLAAGAGALGAVLGGFFAAAGATPGVLLGPLSVLVGGVGQGARAFDGRPCQPGLGTRRPRGFAELEVPEAAWVAIPTAPFAAVIAHAYGAGATLAAVVKPGVEAAVAVGAERRAAWLDRLARVGAAAIAEPQFRRPLLRVGGASEGGLVTPSDLVPPADTDQPASELFFDDSRWMQAPWLEIPSPGGVKGAARAVCAADSHGVLAAACYQCVDSGAFVEELELIAPRAAVPVRRGVPRIAPGTRLHADFAAALRLDGTLRPIEIVVEPDSATLDLAKVVSPRLIVRRDPETRFVSSQRA